MVPASGRAARDHIDATIARPINPEIARGHLSAEDIESVGNDGRGIFAWGAVPGPDNRRTWDAMMPGDYVAFYQSKQYTFLARVLRKKQDRPFATELWGTDGGEKTWELMFFLTPPDRISKTLDDLAEYLQPSPYMGFTKIPANRVTRILENYDDVGSFVEQRFLRTENTFLLLRSNPSSPWDDEDAKKYEFGKTVANYRKVAPGARFIIDQKVGDGVAMIGTGVVAGVQRVTDSDGKLVASYEDFRHFDPPRLLNRDQQALISSQPGYNVQHSIRNLSESAFYKLLSEGASGLTYTPDEFARSIYWDVAAAQHLLDVFGRSKQMILAGPPGTGKSFIANRLADFAVREGGRVERLQFHPSYQYEDFIEGIRPVLATGDTHGEDGDRRSEHISYAIRDGILKRLVRSALQSPAETFVLVIDELNRANVSKVFGELLFCLEYREPEYKVTLPYSDDDFYVPPNVRLIATMNTADRSIALIDAAFRRRFHQYTLTPNLDVIRRWHAERGEAQVGEEAAVHLDRLNVALSDVLDKGRLIGHSFFLRADLDVVGFESIWAEDLEPVLSEHLFSSPSDLERCRDAFLKD